MRCCLARCAWTAAMLCVMMLCHTLVRGCAVTRRYLMEWGLRCQVLDMFSNLFIYIFDELKARFAREIEAVRAQHPFEDLQVGACARGYLI